MDNFISILRDASSPEELEQYKVQLFRENVRIKTDRSELEEMYEQLVLRRKNALRVQYAHSVSFSTDIRILLKTVAAVFRKAVGFLFRNEHR